MLVSLLDPSEKRDFFDRRGVFSLFLCDPSLFLILDGYYIINFKVDYYLSVLFASVVR